MITDWDEFPNFTEDEFRCSHTGEQQMKTGFVRKLQALRVAYGKPMTITSGYRSPEHPIEARKAKPGSHASGRAVDIAVSGEDAFFLLEKVFESGCFSGVGVNQRGDHGQRFIHLDDLDTETRPTVWSY